MAKEPQKPNSGDKKQDSKDQNRKPDRFNDTPKKKGK